MSVQILINIGYLLVLLVLGYVFGRRAEAKHYKDIQQRERQLVALPTTSGEELLGDFSAGDSVLVRGSVVIAVDHFKRLLAGFRAFFGGEVQAYETLLDRARREAVLRMKESCPDATQIINLRIETSSIHRGAQSTGSVEVLAYGTAIYHHKAPAVVVPASIEASAVRTGPTG